ncbi:MAG: hypothetical protein ACOX08_03325 [Methanobacterium sp.]|uniref:hypothetical protein n=1 Tax=Methanobacterium sp. MZD130B TaxID=3394378 RepID=UPI0039FC0233
MWSVWASINPDGKDILVKRFDLNAYEDQSVTVIGTFCWNNLLWYSIGQFKDRANCRRHQDSLNNGIYPIIILFFRDPGG